METCVGNFQPVSIQNLNPEVLMMQTAEDWDRGDAPHGQWASQQRASLFNDR